MEEYLPSWRILISCLSTILGRRWTRFPVDERLKLPELSEVVVDVFDVACSVCACGKLSSGSSSLKNSSSADCEFWISRQIQTITLLDNLQMRPILLNWKLDCPCRFCQFYLSQPLCAWAHCWTSASRGRRISRCLARLLSGFCRIYRFALSPAPDSRSLPRRCRLFWKRFLSPFLSSCIRYSSGLIKTKWERG